MKIFLAVPAAALVLMAGLIGPAPARAVTEQADLPIYVSAVDYSPTGCSNEPAAPYPCPAQAIYTRLAEPVLRWNGTPETSGASNTNAHLTNEQGEHVMRPAVYRGANVNEMFDALVGMGRNIWDQDPRYDGPWMVWNSDRTAKPQVSIPAGRYTFTYYPPANPRVDSIDYNRAAEPLTYALDYGVTSEAIGRELVAPAKVRAVKKTPAKKSVTLRWKAPKSAGAWNAASSYRVKVGKKVRVVKVTKRATSAKVKVKGLKRGKKYAWSVTARNMKGKPGKAVKGKVRTKRR